MPTPRVPAKGPEREAAVRDAGGFTREFTRENTLQTPGRHTPGRKPVPKTPGRAAEAKTPRPEDSGLVREAAGREAGGVARESTLHTPGRQEEAGSAQKIPVLELSAERSSPDLDVLDDETPIPMPRIGETGPARIPEGGYPEPAAIGHALPRSPRGPGPAPAKKETSEPSPVSESLVDIAVVQESGNSYIEAESSPDVYAIGNDEWAQDENSEGTCDEDFATPDETTPATVAKKIEPSPKNLQSISELHSEAPTSVCPWDDFIDDEELDIVVDDELEAWRKNLSVGQQMRVNEQLAIRNQRKKAGAAIRAVSTSTNPSENDAATWETAAQWQLNFPRGMDHRPFLEYFGYQLDSADQWAQPFVMGPHLELNVKEHTHRAGHTWYSIACKLKRVPNAGDGTIEWLAPRRLVQLRVDLHNRIKISMGSAYDEHFQDTRFAKIGGPPGTTARLSAWFGTLASCINRGIVPPYVACLTLVFLHAAVPESLRPAMSMSALRQTAGDSHSNLGGSPGGC